MGEKYDRKSEPRKREAFGEFQADMKRVATHLQLSTLSICNHYRNVLDVTNALQ